MARDSKTRNRKKLEPLVSVVCITRNHERYCVESLESVYNQSYKNIEWIILDAASTDKTVDIIEQWIIQRDIKKIKFIKENHLRPITINLNKAFQHVKGEFVQILSLDDNIHYKKIESQCELFKSNSDCGLVFCDAIGTDSFSNRTINIYGLNDKKFENCSNNKILQKLKQSNFISAPTVLVRSKVIKDLGGFDKKLHIEDWDMWLRILKSRWKVYYLYGVFAEYRVAEGSLWSGKSVNMFISTILTIKKHKLHLESNLIFSVFDRFIGLKKNDVETYYSNMKSPSSFIFAMFYFIYKMNFKLGPITNRRLCFYMYKVLLF